jgi:hypothetical protein
MLEWFRTEFDLSGPVLIRRLLFRELGPVMGLFQDILRSFASITSEKTALPDEARQVLAHRAWLDALPSDAVRRSVVAALAREAAAGSASTPFETRHQRAIQLGFAPVQARVSAAVVRRDAFFTDPWWHRSEVRKPAMHADRDAADPKKLRPDGSRVLSEERHPIALLDGRSVVHVRRVLLSRQKRRFKEFALFETDAKGVLGKPVTMDAVASVLPLFALEAVDPKRTPEIIVTEGVVAAAALIGLGFAATGTLTGALHTPTHLALKPLAAFKTIYLWPDNDSIGVRHMERVAQRLSALGGKDIRVVKWRGGPRKGDAADFNEGEAGVRDLLSRAQAWKPGGRTRNRGQLAIETPVSQTSLHLPLGLRPPHVSVEPFSRKPSPVPRSG